MSACVRACDAAVCVNARCPFKDGYACEALRCAELLAANDVLRAAQSYLEKQNRALQADVTALSADISRMQKDWRVQSAERTDEQMNLSLAVQERDLELKRMQREMDVLALEKRRWQEERRLLVSQVKMLQRNLEDMVTLNEELKETVSLLKYPSQLHYPVESAHQSQPPPEAFRRRSRSSRSQNSNSVVTPETLLGGIKGSFNVLTAFNQQQPGYHGGSSDATYMHASRSTTPYANSAAGSAVADAVYPLTASAPVSSAPLSGVSVWGTTAAAATGNNIASLGQSWSPPAAPESPSDTHLQESDPEKSQSEERERMTDEQTSTRSPTPAPAAAASSSHFSGSPLDFSSPSQSPSPVAAQRALVTTQVMDAAPSPQRNATRDDDDGAEPSSSPSSLTAMKDALETLRRAEELLHRQQKYEREAAPYNPSTDATQHASPSPIPPTKHITEPHLPKLQSAQPMSQRSTELSVVEYPANTSATNYRGEEEEQEAFGRAYKNGTEQMQDTDANEGEGKVEQERYFRRTGDALLGFNW